MIMAEQQESGRRSDDGGDAAPGAAQGGDAVEKLRTVVDQASRSIKDWTQAGEQWAHEAQDRARGAAKELRGQGERAVETVQHKVEHNPLASLAVAFAAGFVVARLMRR